MTIHAHTDQGATLPAYINISERVSIPGDIIVTVRSAGENASSSLILNREQAVALAHDIFRHYRAPASDVKAAVDRFLGWPLPQGFAPDAGISFTPPTHPHGWPVGTNLLSSDQARAMFEYCLRDPAA
jgi:hypothetical protein